ncbi:MAG: prolyl oligopeptidase family serine peptidase [Gemmatimonadales bacterium]|jgi:dipeptidyl aminopeptidase/acylaminoacyl peptidase
MHSRCLTALALTTIVLMAVPSAARAQAEGELPPLIPIQHFFDNPEIAGAQISPNGQFISYLKPYQEKLNVYVRQIGSSEERRMTTDTIRPVRGYFWSADGSMLLYVQDKGGNENFHVYSVPIEGNATPDAKDLTPHDGVRAVIFAVPPERPSEILIGLNMRDPSLFDAYWLDVETGETRLVAENPGNFVGVIPDHDLQVRLAMGQNAEGGTSFYTRSSDEDPEWREVVAYSASETVRPFRFHPDNRRVYMASNVGDTNLQRLVLLDLETGEVQEVESDPEGEVDFGSAIFSDLTDELIATVYVADTVRIYPKNEQVATDIARLRQVHDGTPNVSSTTTDETKWMVSFDAPTDPGATYLYDRETGEAEFLFRPRPWLEPDQLANVRPVSFPARDGLGVNGYLTLPRGVEPKSLPMVLLVHGGPWARDDWGYQPEAQMLANRGYAVLQVNYRGSTGYGKRFFNAAVKEFAGKMHDDLIDGVKWAVAEGIADPDLVGVYGGSYGGYATLVSLTFTPEVFACGVDYVGPSSLITLIESFPAYWRPFLKGYWYRFVGDPSVEADREDMKTRSPLFYVDQIEDPILIVQGANDPRVTKLESDQMVVALRDRGIKVSYLVAENEGHGFANADNRMALYRSMETFFGECLGGRVQDQVPDEIQTKIAELTVDVDGVSVVAEEQGR